MKVPALSQAVLLLTLQGFGPRTAYAEPEPYEIVVSGTRLRAPKSSRDPSAASTVVPRERLQEPGASAADVLADVPGVQVQRTGADNDLATASIRGASSDQVPVYLAGIRVNDDVTGSADLSALPLWMLDRVEVFRGQSPDEGLRLGLGGALFLEPRLPTRPSLRSGLLVGSFGQRGYWVGGETGSKRAGALVALRSERADNDDTFVNDNGTRFDPSDDQTVRRRNADYEMLDVWSVGRYRLSSRGARATLVLNSYERRQGVTGLGPNFAELARGQTRRQLAGVTISVPCAFRDGMESCRLELKGSALRASQLLLDPAGELGLAAMRLDVVGQRFEQAGRVTTWLTDDLALTTTVAYAAETLHLDSPGQVLARAGRRTLLGGGGVQQHLGSDWLVHGFVRGACHTTAGPSGIDACGDTPIEGRLGASAQLAEPVTLLANAGRMARVPTLGERFGVSPLVRGNEQLTMEQGYSADVGARVEPLPSAAIALWSEAFVFGRWVEDLIAFQRSSLGFLRPFNVGRARVLGVEGAAGARLAGFVDARLTLTALDPRDTSSDRVASADLIPFLSRFTANAEVVTEARQPFGEGLVDRVAFGLRGEHRGSRVADPAGLIVIEAQTVFGLTSGLWLWRERFALRAVLENLFDTVRFDAVGLPLPGRSAHASVEVVVP